MTFQTVLRWGLGLSRNVHEVVASFPREKAIVKRLEIPSSDPKEIHAMVTLQAYRQIPLPPEEIVVRSCLLGGGSEGHTVCLMIVIRKDDLEEHLNGLLAKGVIADRLILDSAPGTNLLPDEAIQAKRRERRWGELAAAGALSLLLCAVSFSVAAARFQSKKHFLRTLETEERMLGSEAKELRRKESQLELIRNQLRKNGSLLDVMAELNQRLPEKVSIQSVVFEKDRLLQIQGTCLALTDAVRLVNDLQKSKLFGKVELVSSNSRQTPERDVTDFQLKVDL